MKNNNRNKELLTKISNLIKMYDDMFGKSVEVFDEIEKIVTDEMENDDIKNDLLKFLNSDDSGKLIIRLIIALQYVAFPTDRTVVSDLSMNITENNLQTISNAQDLDDLFNFNQLLMYLLKVGVVDYDYDDDDYEEELETKKKRLLH